MNHRLLLLGLIPTILLGCPQQPPHVSPVLTWEEEPGLAGISQLSGPAHATQAQPVGLTVTVEVGSSTCNKLGTVKAEVDEAAKEVRVSATRYRAVSANGAPFGCSADWVSKAATVSFTPESTGTYRVQALNFSTMSLSIKPATMDIEVQAP